MLRARAEMCTRAVARRSRRGIAGDRGASGRVGRARIERGEASRVRRADPRATMKKPAAKAAKAAKAAPKAKAKAEKKKPAPQMPFRGYWDDKEEQALRDAVQKHGIGAWEKMRHDADFKVLKCVPSPAPREIALHPRRVVREPRIDESFGATRVPPRGFETFPRLDPSLLPAPSARARARSRAIRSIDRR